MKPSVLAVILARAGSKGLPGKCVAPLAGKPLIEHTIEYAKAARRIDAICVSTDSLDAAAIAQQHGLAVIERPAALATDNAPVDAALRHAVETYESIHRGFVADHVVLLYGNVPIRAADIIDRAVAHLIATGCDSVRSVAPIGKHHPDWLHRLDGDRMSSFRPNLIHRRQDLEPLYYHDAAVVAVTRAALYATRNGPNDHHAFFGIDRRALIQPADATVDVDTALDLSIAEGILRHRAATRGAAKYVRIGKSNVSGVFIIAEAGVNHDGNIDAAIELVRAARAGADAVKFQAFSADRLVARAAAACDYQRGHTVAATQHEMLRRLELNRDAFARLKREAEALNIEFLATPFGVNELEMLVELGVPAIKLASTDITNTPLLEAAAKSGVPLIAATGAADMQEVRAAMSILSAAPAVALLHCVSKYPTPLAEANLAAIAALRREFDVAVGYSDHTPDVYTAGLAVAAGATVLEKHLTLDRSSAGPDHFFSLTPEDFPAYVAAAREAAAALGTGQVACDANQLEVRRLTRRSIIARAPIARGMPVVGTLLDTQRPGGGIDPIHWNRVIGRVAAADIPAGARIEWDMLAAD